VSGGALTAAELLLETTDGRVVPDDSPLAQMCVALRNITLTAPEGVSTAAWCTQLMGEAFTMALGPRAGSIAAGEAVRRWMHETVDRIVDADGKFQCRHAQGGAS